MVNAINNISKYFDKELIKPLQQRFVGRKLVPKNTELSGKGIGMESVDVWTFSRLKDATITLGIPEPDGDTADVTSASLQIPIISEPFTLPRRMYEAYKFQGIGIEAAMAIEAAYRVQLQEEALILNGWAPDGTNYVVSGLYQSAGNTEATADDFGTYGNAIDKVALAIATLETDSVYGPYNMVLNPTQANELYGSYSTTGASEVEQVMKQLNRNGSGGQIFSSPAVTVETGMVMAVPNKAYYDLVIPQDYKNILNEDPKLGTLSPLYGRVYEALAPRIKQTNAICTLTNI
jgi:uncharacterized linocin/CFP29 family protein